MASPTLPTDKYGIPTPGELSALSQLLQIVGQYGLPLVLSVVLVGFILFKVDQASNDQTALLREINATHTHIAQTLDRLQYGIDALNAKLTPGGGNLVPVR
jgi:hypothetical protein